ncbi:MAG: hypothetical protein ABJC89_17520 [Acidobacteriota bacterium]
MNPLQPPDHWDFAMITTQRAKAIEAFGFSERQARFLLTVMLHSGVFVERQYCAFAGIVHGQKTTDFLRKLVDAKLAVAVATGAVHRGRLIHVRHKPLYAAIGQVDNRNRKPAELGRLIERVMLLDAVLDDGGFTWLGTERDKRWHFERRLGDRLRPNEFPILTFGSKPRQTVRYFPDKMPIGMRSGEDPVVFVYLVTRPSPCDFRLFLWRHAELFRALRTWTLRLLVPGVLRKAMPLYMQAVREEWTTPLSPAVTDQLRSYFRSRKGGDAAAAPAMDPGRKEASERFRGPRFRALYRAWQQHGDAVLWSAQSSVLKSKFFEGDARIECVELDRQYLHLSPLVGKS